MVVPDVVRPEIIVNPPERSVGPEAQPGMFSPEMKEPDRVETAKVVVPEVVRPGPPAPEPPLKGDEVSSAGPGGVPWLGVPLVSTALADRAAELARHHMEDLFGAAPCDDEAKASAASAEGGSSTANTTGVIATPTPLPPRRGPPRPPACPAPPHDLQKSDVWMAMAPFKPPDAVTDEPVKLERNGSAWRLEDGGWAFQYPNMVAHVDSSGEQTRVAWPDRRYAIEQDPTGISYHAGSTVIHRDIGGDLVFHQPTGTIHQKGDTTIYHWCDPNVIVYHTPSGIVYYDNDGMTYRGRGGVAHYARDGSLVYQGVGGITEQTPDGVVTHWTESGVVYRRDDGSMAYTPVGESQPRELALDALGPDPFPGPPLSEAEITALADAVGANATTAAAADDAMIAVAAKLRALAGGAPAPAPASPLAA